MAPHVSQVYSTASGRGQEHFALQASCSSVFQTFTRVRVYARGGVGNPPLLEHWRPRAESLSVFQGHSASSHAAAISTGFARW